MKRFIRCPEMLNAEDDMTENTRNWMLVVLALVMFLLYREASYQVEIRPQPNVTEK